MNESFLWYLWKYRLFHHDLTTTDGEPVIVEYPGQQNDDSGPDFSHARVRISKMLWAGNVEVHVRAGDWMRHGHQHDKAYDNVILHVVFENDVTIRRPGGQIIPVIALKDFIDPLQWQSYRKLMKSGKQIPCSGMIRDLDPLTLQQGKDRALANRLERKINYVNQLLLLYRGNLEEVFYQMLASCYGFKINALPFELLSRSINLKTLKRHSSSLMQTEALLYGQAGLLDADFKEDYPNQLKKEYIYLQQKLNLKPLEARLWKFSRMHPPNFPTIRIAQFAQLIHSQKQILAGILDEESVENVKLHFQFPASPYWNRHFVFDKESAYAEKKLGSAAAESILINAVVPFLFHYGKSKGNDQICSRALQWLENCMPENNTIIRNWHKEGVLASSAYDTQALIELKNEFCLKKNCLNCVIGVKLLQQKQNDSR
jgi:Protein of unknown function (DUF2851)